MQTRDDFMKNILVYAYLNSNFGDDLFVDILLDRYPDCHFSILALGEKKLDFLNKHKNADIIYISYLLKGINLISRKIFGRDLAYEFMAKKYDAFVLIGGSMFIENSGWQKRLIAIESFSMNIKKRFIIGANFGPYKSYEFFKSHEKLFMSFSSVCFRDKKSYNLFKHISHVKSGIDIAFSINNMTERCIIDNKYVAIAVCNFVSPNLQKYKNSYLESLVHLCDKLIERKHEVMLVGLCRNEGDVEIINQISSRINSAVDFHVYSGNINETIDVFAKAHTIFATRFHSMIIGFLLKKKTIPLIYSIKMDNVLNDSGFKNNFYHIENIENLDIESCLNQNYEFDISEYCKQNIVEFEDLDKYI